MLNARSPQTSNVSLQVHVALPVLSGGSGGFSKHLSHCMPLWLSSARVESVMLHAPVGVLPAIDELKVAVKRYRSRKIGPFAQQFAPMIEAQERAVVLSATSRPIKVGGVPIVTMVRNVEPIQATTYQMPLLWRLRLWALRKETMRACRQATRVLAVSGYVKHCLCKLGVSEKKIDVVHHGGSPPSMAEHCPSVCAGLATRFIFSAGSMVPYRGYEDLLQALAVLKAEGHHLLVAVIGGSGAGLAKPYKRRVHAMSKALGVEHQVLWAGQLSEAEMNWCFRHAALVVQTSRAESFCMFQVEAMYSGALVISCTQPPMPEILGDAAMYYRLGDAEDLARTISKCLSLSKVEAARWRQAALMQASKYSWNLTASKTLDVLETAREDFSRTRR